MIVLLLPWVSPALHFLDSCSLCGFSIEEAKRGACEKSGRWKWATATTVWETSWSNVTVNRQFQLMCFSLTHSSAPHPGCLLKCWSCWPSAVPGSPPEALQKTEATVFLQTHPWTTPSTIRHLQLGTLTSYTPAQAPTCPPVPVLLEWSDLFPLILQLPSWPSFS